MPAFAEMLDALVSDALDDGVSREEAIEALKLKAAALKEELDDDDGEG